jgi:hypothetical protein
VEEFKRRTGLTDVNPETLQLFMMANLNQQRMALSDYLQTLAKDGIPVDHTDALLALSGDPDAIQAIARKMATHALAQAHEKDHKIPTDEERETVTALYLGQITETSKLMKASLFREADAYTSDDWRSDPPENIVISDPKPLSAEQKKKVYRLQLELMHAKDILNAHPSIVQRVKSAFKTERGPTAPSFLDHLKDPFITQTLTRYVKDGKTDPDLVPYHAGQYLDWVARLEMLKITGATQYAYEYVPNGTAEPDVRLTDQPMTIERAENEILHDTIGAQNLPKKFIEYKKWKKKAD